MPFSRICGIVLISGFTLLATGCVEYATPGRAADLRAVGVTQAIVASGTEAGIEQHLGKKPLAALPTGLAVVRLQAPGYRSATAQGFGEGRYSVVTTRDVEPEAAVGRLAKMSMVNGVATINRLLLPEKLQSDVELRNAAAQLHADMLLIYTVDTTFQKNDLAEPLTLVTLGLSPNQRATIVSTASAVLMDTRNGYVYGVCEATTRTTKLMGAWGSNDAIDESRLKTEGEAFEKLVGQVEKMWVGVVKEFGAST